ncbi:uncharacterized protein LOC116851724 isoform X2 [Odontomachus brunneus]|uniref:uncharacterized protein LOC116851724 isoform X2 n=1 Tax=Odontomachus brunneus TaxID=486640 RepID=UPI0013F1B10B|nr:uncharacterized protein LOC116851724 isoform X2 [Odontomachus brunneus]
MTSKQSWPFDIDRLSDAVNGLQKCLECTICLELMTTPVKTRCGHSFCKKCIGKVLHQKACCPLCNEILNKRSISKDDHLESCIQKFKNLMIVIQIDSHIDVLSHSKQPRDTRECYSNSDSSQSSVSHKRKRIRSIRSNQTTFEINRPSTSRRTVTDCDNPQYDANSLAGYDQSLSTLTNLLPTDGNDNTLYDTPDVKVRTWIHSFIESTSSTTIKGVENEVCPSEENTSRVSKKRRRSSDTRKADSSKLKYNAIHSKVRTKDRKRSIPTDVGKPDVEERNSRSRDDSSFATSSNQTHQADAFDRSHGTNTPTVGNKPSSTDTTWSRVREIGKEMRGKKKRVKKLSVSTERSTGKNTEKSNESPEKNNESRDEKNTESNKSKNVPRIIEDIVLIPRKKYESLDKSATNDDTSNKEASVSKKSRESNSSKWDAIDEKSSLSNAKVKTNTSANETTARNREESFTSDKTNCSMSEANPCSLETSLVITLEEGEKLPIRNLNSRQMNEIIGCKGDLKGLVDDANTLEKRHLMKEKDKEQKEDVEIMMEPFDSPSHQQRLIILTPEKLNESVDKCRANHNTDLRTPVRLETNPTSSLPTESQTTPNMNNDAGRTTTTTPVEGTSDLRTQTLNKSRLSLKRTPKTLGSPLFSQTPLMERISINKSVSLKSRKSVDLPVSNDGPSFDRLATVRRDLSSQISDRDRPSTDQATTAVGMSTKSTVEDNNRNVGGTVCQDKRLSIQSTSSKKSRRIDSRSHKEGCKFMQLGTLVRRRDVKYYYKGATKCEIYFPAKIRVASVYNMQQSASKSDMQPRAEDKSRSFESLLTTFNDSQDSTDVTVVENVHKSAASLDNTVLENTKLTYGVSASSTPKANADRRLDRAETTARGSSSTSVIHKTLIAEEAPRSPRTSRADQNVTQQGTPRANSIRLLSPDKDSQLKFLTMDSPMSQHGQSRLASSAQSELERGLASTKDNNLVEVRDSQRTVRPLEPLSERLESAKKRKRDDSNDDDNDDGNSSVSAVSMSSQCTVKLCQDKKSRLNLPCNRGDEVICLDLDDRSKAHERKFKRIVSISDSDTDTESLSTRVAKKSNRNKSSDRCDQGNASITSTSKRKKLSKRVSDEDFRIRSIVDKWSNEHSATQKRLTKGTKSAQDAAKPTRLNEKIKIHRHSSFSTNSSEGAKRGSAKSNEKNTESELFFESNSIFNSEGLEQLVVRQSSDKSNKGRKEQESSNSIDPLADDIVNKVLQINRPQQSNPAACRSTGVTSRVNDDGTNQKDKSERYEYNLLQDNFDEIIASVELPQSEDVVPCSELPAHRNSDRNLSRTLTEQNTSSCPAMTNESRDVARHGQMKPASSTADIFEYCGYSGGKSVKKAHPTSTSGNSNKENIVSHGQRKHDHAEEDRRDKKNVAARSPDSIDKAGREKSVSRNNVSQEKRGPFDRTEMTERTSRMEINVPVGSTSQADHDGRVQERANNESNAKDFSSDSLMNITQHQDQLRMIEEDLFGIAPAWIDAKASKTSSDDSLREEQRTPKKRKKGGVHKKNATSQEHSADEDDIVENTPETKMRNTPKVTSSSITSGRRDDVSTTGNIKQLSKRRATAASADDEASSSTTKQTTNGNTSRNTCQQVDRGRLRFVCTGLAAIQIANVQRFARLHNAEYAKQFDPSVTHVIVNTIGAENAAKSTLKYLQGIAHCKWVVSYKWIEDCTSERQLLPESPYEATTQSAEINGPGPRNSRLSRKGLFEDFTFLCVGPYDNVSLSQYQDLLRATGATVVNSLQALATEKGLRGIVIQGDHHAESTIESWYRDVRAPPILIDWIVECIGHYKLLQLIPYIQTLSPQDYYALGYPREIVGEEEYSDMSA